MKQLPDYKLKIYGEGLDKEKIGAIDYCKRNKKC